MSIEDTIKIQLARMLERELNLKDVVVVRFEEEFDAYTYHGCHTCGPEIEKEYSVDIYYVTPGENRMVWTYSGTFTDLIKELDNDN
jgi:hypothetical protein